MISSQNERNKREETQKKLHIKKEKKIILITNCSILSRACKFVRGLSYCKFLDITGNAMNYIEHTEYRPHSKLVQLTI